MSVIITERSDTLNKFRSNTNDLSTLVGDITNLRLITGNTNVISTLQELIGVSKAEVAVKQVIEGAYNWSVVPYAANNTVDTTGSPAYLKYTRTIGAVSDYVKCALTWGSSGGADGNVTSAIYSYSTNSSFTGAITIITNNLTYDSNGNVSQSAWVKGV